MNYYLNCNGKYALIQISKNCTLRIDKSNGEIIIKKEKNSFIHDDENHSMRNHSLSGHIIADDIYTQLANVKHIGFEVTDACNLKCTYCTYGEFYNDYDDRVGKNIDPQKAKVLLNYFINNIYSSANESLNNEVLISFYGGEPLLNISFIKEMVYYTQQIQDHRVKFKYTMTTNAIYLNKYIDFLYHYDFNILVSLDGAKENNAHRKFANKKSSFDIIYRNIKYIQSNYSDYFNKNISFISVMHNFNNIEEVFSFFKYNFDKIPRFSEVNSTGVRPELEIEFNDLIQQKPFMGDKGVYAEMEKVLDLNSNQSKQLQHFIFNYSENIYYNYNALLVKREKKDHLPTATCLPFSKRVFMTVNNKILPCEKIGQQFSLGEVTDHEVKIDCESIAKKYNDYYDSLNILCENCFYKMNCTKCMFSIKNLEKNPDCDQFANKQMFDEYLQKNMNILYNNPELYKRIMDELIIVE